MVLFFWIGIFWILIMNCPYMQKSYWRFLDDKSLVFLRNKAYRCDMRLNTFSCFIWIIPLICSMTHSTGPSESVWICPDPLQHWLWHNGAEEVIGYTSGQWLSQQQDLMSLLCRCPDPKRTPGKVRKWHFRDCIRYKKMIFLISIFVF